MKRILITGGTGFVGGNLAARCKHLGHDVKTLGRGNKGNPDYQLDIGYLDEEVTNFDIIFHCASTVNEYNLLHGTFDDIDTNCTGTQVLLEACRKHNPWVRLIYVSTFFVNGNPTKLPVSIKDPCNPLGMYGITKLAAEQMCSAYHRIFGLDIQVARLTNIYGVGQGNASQKTAAFNWMVKTCVEDGTISLYDNGKIKRDYLYVSDAVDALLTIAMGGAPGANYFVGTGIGTSFYEMVHMMIKNANGGKIRPVESPGFHQRVGIGDFWCDNKEICGLGWHPEISLEAGIKHTVEFYRNGV